jgi:hypothetical protein
MEDELFSRFSSWNIFQIIKIFKHLIFDFHILSGPYVSFAGVL